jgi:hypothetical protein
VFTFYDVSQDHAVSILRTGKGKANPVQVDVSQDHALSILRTGKVKAIPVQVDVSQDHALSILRTGKGKANPVRHAQAAFTPQEISLVLMNFIVYRAF